ncbi:MAG: IS4 family transposase [Myxococcaceae bacterium]
MASPGPGNDRVTPAAILEPHYVGSAARAAARSSILVLHDTSEFEFSGEAKREGLGRLLRKGQGFFGHFSLAVDEAPVHEPLGLLAFESIFRHKAAVPRKKLKKKHYLGESARWARAVEAAQQRLPDSVRAIHVMDREGDSFALLAAMVENGREFVVRSNHDRVLAGVAERTNLRVAARGTEPVLEREVSLSYRPVIPGPKGLRHPARDARVAFLTFAATTVSLPRTANAKAGAASTISVNVVHVYEPDPPSGEDPVELFLLTSLPIETPEQIAYVVDCYRARWIIEEYFKALKTGCQVEKRQLTTAKRLLNALAVLAPVAWRLLLLRHLSRHEPDRPARHALTPTQIAVLLAISKIPLPKNPSVRDALLARTRPRLS